VNRTQLLDAIVRIETGHPYDVRLLLPLLSELADAGGLESIKDASFEQGYDQGAEDAYDYE
jgi:hypothetical protein